MPRNIPVKMPTIQTIQKSSIDGNRFNGVSHRDWLDDHLFGWGDDQCGIQIPGIVLDPQALDLQQAHSRKHSGEMTDHIFFNQNDVLFF